MATAPVAGGLYFVNGVAVNAEGVAVEDAPKPTPDTIAAPPGSAKSIAQEIAEGVATALHAHSAPPAEPHAAAHHKKG